MPWSFSAAVPPDPLAEAARRCAGLCARAYLIVRVVALWFLDLPSLGPVALTGAVVCGAGGLIGSVLAFHEKKNSD